ncbi:uncharacterized protein LOC127730411 isoform X2 [Mytilus californianus]|uniref:uncharacterized protein LOC127730411 isoform X2 n=1 Tax=Mytilus californianus TaxID=6549 RepID=UPI002246E5CB|nr:uncharacterized protein LOC127730411 isoform X2 [Mytilus californianus]
MHERECTVSYSATQAGWYGVAIQIEDFISTGSMEALSSVPLQFLVVVFRSNTTCASKPTFVEPTRIEGSCIGIPFNTTYFEPIISNSGSQTISIREIQTASPQGMVKSELDVYANREWYVNISWTPDTGQAGPHIFCYTALDSNGANSDSICIRLLVGVSPPDIVEVHPVGDLFPNHSTWTIKFDKQFERPNRTTYMYFKENDTDAVIYKIDISTSKDAHFPQGAIEKTLIVNTNFEFTEKKHYYVNLDPGAARGKTNDCKVESSPIRNKTFWEFRIRDVTKPELTFISRQKATNGNITVSWTFNEPVTSKCTIVKPDATKKANCTDYWSGDNLKEGFYTLFIFGTDLEGNQADVGKYEFQIDTTPPDIFINDKPHDISKHQQFTFSLSCNENCSTYCSLYEEGSFPTYVICNLFNTMFSLKDNTTYVFLVKAVDAVGNEGNSTLYRFKTDFTPPSMTTLVNQTLMCGADFNPNITGIPIVTDNNPNGTNIIYTDSVGENCGIQRVWTATDAAGNEAIQTQVILFESPTPIRLLFAREALVPCGDIDDFTKSMQQYISKNVNHPCGIPFKRIYFTDSNILNKCGITIIRTWHIEDSCGSTTNGTQQIKILQLEVPVTPKNGQVNVELQSTLRWPSYPKATRYEIYLWLYGQEKPEQPVITIQSRTYWKTSRLTSNTKYSWKVEIDIGENDTIPGPKWSFETRKIPDLTVERIIVPKVAFSGQSFVVQWSVRNTGTGITETASWNDLVFFSFTDSFEDAKRFRSPTVVMQRNILFPEDGYTSQAKVNLHEGDMGLFWVFVETRYQDYNTTNNVRDHRIDVKLTPPPDLQIDSIIIQDVTFSGSSLPVIYNVRNHGDGATTVDSWVDDIYWSDDDNLDWQDIHLKRHYRIGKLVPDESYTVHLSILVPRNIYGNYTIIVHSDSASDVYEHGMDENNRRVSKILQVTLTPPPDLTIREIFTEKTFFVTGDAMVIKWTVINDGYRSPYAFYWIDNVKLNLLEQPGRSYNIGQQSYSTKLDPTMSYSHSITYNIPANVQSGTYNISVITDYYNHVFEFQNEDNNGLNKEIEIQKSLPDLFVNNISVEVKSNVTFNSISVSWTAENTGKGKTLISRWMDKLIAVVHSNNESDYILGQFYGGDGHILSPNQSYIIQNELVLPPYVYGDVFFRVHIDYLSQTADNNWNNNMKMTHIFNISLKSPDLYIHKFKVISDEVYSGGQLELECSVGNLGVTIQSNQRWYHKIIVSSTSSQYTDIDSEESVQFGPLHTEQISRTTTLLQIPKLLYGEVYLHCIVETTDDMFEGREPSRIENNHKIITLFVNRPPSPDLLIDFLKVSLKNSSSSQSLVSVTWSVHNKGNSMPFRSNWLDAVGISRQNYVQISDIARHIEILYTFEIMYGLESSASYSMSKTVVIPKQYVGIYYVYVITDYADTIFEFNEEDNNIALSKPIVIPPIPMSQLNVSFLFNETMLSPGSSISTSFLTENTGSARTRLTSWEDLVYMCPIQNASKQVLLDSGYLLSTTLHVGALDPGETYLTNVTLIIPNDINSQIFFYVISFDDDETGLSVDLSSQASSLYFHKIAIYVEHNRLPNMIVSANESIGPQKGGQPLLISYNFTNNGVIPSSRVFYNSFYLSDDYLRDEFDLKLITSYYSESIEVNETINDTVSVFLPYDLKSRNYFIIIEVDSGNAVYEFDELDNEFVISMSIEQTLSTDVAVVDVKTAEMVSYGDNLEVHWKLRNNGTISAQGYTCDSVFLSADRKWDIEDKQIGQTTCRFVTLQPYDHLSSITDVSNSLSGKIPEMSEASYVAMVKSRSNILDKYLENNVGFSYNGTNIKVTHLYLNTVHDIRIGTDNAKLFLLPNISSEETIVIRSECKSIDTFYEIKVKYGKAATDVDFDYISDDPFKSNQTIIIPMTKFGNYYILVTTTNSGDHVSSVDVNLFVKLARFEILSVFPTRAIPLGNATLKIEGTLFPEELDMTLFGTTLGELKPLKIFRFSSTLLYATFDFRLTIQGQRFSLNLTNSLTGNTTVLEDALEISTGEVGKVSTQIDMPNALLPGQRGVMYLYIKNIGDTDIVSPLIFIQTNGIAHLNFESDSEEVQFWEQNIIIASSENTPGGVLPPGASYRFVFNVKQIENSKIGRSKISVSLIKPLKETNHVYFSTKDHLRTSDINDEAWDRIWDNFIQLIGTSWYSLNWKVSEIMNQLSLAGRNVIQLSDIVAMLLDMAGGHNEDTILTQENDIIVRRKSRNLGLDFRRFFSSKVFSRYHKSVMGKGWMLPYWSTHLNAVHYDEANVTFNGKSYIFERQVDGIYQNKYLGELRFSSNGTNNLTYIYIDKIEGREYLYSNETGLLIAIKSINDNSFVKLHYKDNQLQQIEHSDGPFLVMTYNERGFINWVELRNDSDNEQESIYDYDMDNDWLISSDVNGKITRYEYNSDNSIKRIKYSSGSIEEFEYYPQGWLKSIELITNGTQMANKVYTFIGEAIITTLTQPDNVTQTLTYDENGEIALRKRFGFSTEKIQNTEHDKIVSQGDFIVSKNIYDELTNSVLCEDANGDFVTVSYNDHGRVTVLKDSDNNAYSVTYNPDGNIRAVLYPDNTTEEYDYEKNERNFKSRSGENIRSEIDDNGNVLVKDFGNDRVYSFSYDKQHRLKEARMEMGTTSIGYTYNGLPEYVKFQYFEKDIYVNYSLNENFQKSSMKLSLEGYDVNYEYNSRNLLTRVINSYDNTSLLKVEYNEKMQLKKKILGNGAETVYSYFVGTDLLKGVYNYLPNGNLSSKFEYLYDLRQRRISLKTMDGNWKFRYDPSGQLTYVKHPDGTVKTLQYDKHKNRKAVAINDIRKEYTANSLNQYTKYGNDQTFKHDKNGNLISKDGPTKEDFIFNAENQLVQFRTSDNECTLEYDGLKNLVRKSCENERTEYVVDAFGRFGQDILAEITYKGESTDTQLYFHGGDQLGLIAMKNKNGYYYYQFDPMGSVVSMLDKNGDILNSYRYDPFGNITSSIEELQNPFTFIGQWGAINMKQIKELYLMRTRCYDSEHGRFLSMDQFALDGKLKNFYAYAYNNPVHFLDPKGNYAFLVTGAVNLAFYLGYNYLTNQESTLGGAAFALMEGMIGGPIAGKIGGKIAGYIGKKCGKVVADFTKRVIETVAAEVEKVIKESVFGDKPFSWKGFGKDLATGLISSFYPSKKDAGKLRKAADVLLSNILGEIIDPNKSWNDKLQDAKNIASNLWPDALNKLIDKIIEWIRSHDPNDIIGPLGYGAARFIQKDTTMSIKIRFENVANATAPAQKVFIVYELDKSIDMRTFKLGKFGFGNFNHELKERTHFQVSVNLTEIYEGLFVRVRGGLDILKKRVTWEFQTVEASTGLSPSDPRKGFLPPNNGTDGQGYVTFSVKPKTDVKTMTRIDLKASIYFDQNEPVDTPLIFNTIDDSPPDINGSVVQEMLNSEILAVAISYHDIGSGFQYTDVLLKSEYGYETLLTGITKNVIQIPLPPGEEYQLLFSPVDFTDNRPGLESIKEKNSIHVHFPRVPGICNDKNNCSGNGNCTNNNNCVCDFGFYGSDCSGDTPPVEPPIVDARDAEGFEDSEIAIYMSAKATNGTPYDSFKIYIINFPENSTFSFGHLVDYRWELNFSDFGNISFMPPRDLSGNFTFHVLAELVQGSRNSTRNSFISVLIKPIVDGVDMRVRVDCFSMKKHYANLQINAPLKDIDSSETLEISVTVPENFNLSLGQEIITGTFVLSSMDVLNTIEVFGTNMSEVDHFNITIVAKVVENGTSLQESYSDTVIVEKCTDLMTSTMSVSPGQSIVSSTTNSAAFFTTQKATSVASTEGVEKTYIERIDLRLDFEVTVDLTDTTTATYKKLFQDTFTGLFEYYSHSSIKDAFINITLFSIAKGSLIANHDVITSTESKEDITMILDAMKQKHLLKIGNQTVKALSFNVIDDSTESGTSKLSKLWIAVISACSAVFGFIVIVTTVHLIRKQMIKHKPEQNLEVQEDSQRLMDMTTIRMYRPKLLTELSHYENPAFVPTKC